MVVILGPDDQKLDNLVKSFGKFRIFTIVKKMQG